ncbi:hypothetical protein Ancab_004878 [Ancistrocladus abbreviatus]
MANSPVWLKETSMLICCPNLTSLIIDQEKALSLSWAKKISKKSTTIKPEDYALSPVHYAVAVGYHTALSRLVSSLPRLTDPSRILTDSDSLTQERVVDQISAVLDRRDVPFRETPLYVDVQLNDTFAARMLSSAGADISLQNSSGWNPL